MRPIVKHEDPTRCQCGGYIGWRVDSSDPYIGIVNSDPVDITILGRCEECGTTYKGTISGLVTNVVTKGWDGKQYLNVYLVTREYGGPEEGGWYYDCYRCVETIGILPGTDVEELRVRYEEDYKDEKYGDISSVRGGQDVRVCVEKKPRASETTEKPIYC